MAKRRIEPGDEVTWKWGSGEARGEVVERFEERVERTIDGSTITRNATEDEPAFLIRQGDGQRVLKSVTEIERS